MEEQMQKQRYLAFNLKEAERKYFAQLATGNYLISSDRNTKFFHSIIKSNRSRNNITGVQLVDGSMSSSIEQAALCFVQFFTDLLGSAQPVQEFSAQVLNRGPLLSPQQADSLTVPFSEAEVETGLLSIGKDKSPGPDGYTFQFFINA